MAAALTLRKLRKWHALDQKRLAAQRKASDLAKLQAPLEAGFLEHVTAEGGELRAVTAHGYRVAISTKREGVKWAAAFLVECGEDRAEALRKAAPEKDVLEVSFVRPVATEPPHD